MTNDISTEYNQFIQNYNDLKSEFYSPTIYQSFNFQQYVKNKYYLTKEVHYLNQSNLLLLYALEWFNYNKNDKLSLIKYHPYLRNVDYDILEQYRTKNKNNLKLLCLCMIGTVGIYWVSKIKISPFTITVLGIKMLGLSLFTALSSWFYLNNKLNSFIENDKDLKRYLELDIDKIKIKKELAIRGILIEDKPDKYINSLFGSIDK